MKRVFIVMIALLAFGLVIGCGGRKKSDTAAKTAVAKAEVKTVNDVVCVMKVDTSRVKITSEYEGKTYYFCSADCKGKFDADPAKYAMAESKGEQQHDQDEGHDQDSH